MLLAQNCLQINYNHNFFKLQIIILDLSPTGHKQRGRGSQPRDQQMISLSCLEGAGRGG